MIRLAYPEMAAPSQIAHYQITSKLGEGGMGAVYRAVDTKLHRDVAIKVLPPAFAADSARMARFEREAQVLASLNHPNIAAIYGIEQGAIVMELIDGAGLAGPLPIDTVIDYARQIAAGLEAAHEKGIVHRDLKPANIKVTRGGQIKILDFGLAKASEAAPHSGNPSISPTLSVGMTEAGVILGTAAYMSPEQARGKPVDQRSDIWAFGVVLYELVTGRRLFEGEDLGDTLAAVVKADPDLTEVPEPVRGVLQRCLQKDPNKRLRHISSVELLLERPEAPPQPVVQKARTAALSGLAALLFVAAVAGWLLYLRRPEAAKPEVIRLEIPIPPDISLVASDNLATNPSTKVSPDGRMVAFAARGGGDARARIWIRQLDSLVLRPLAGTEGASGHPIWLPGSRMLAFASDGKLRKIDVTGGPPQLICDFGGGIGGGIGGGFVTPENKIVFGRSTVGIEECPADGGEVKSVTALEPGAHDLYHAFPTLLPDGRHFLFVREGETRAGIYVGSLDAKPEEQTRKRLLADRSATLYVPGANSREGTLLFVRQYTLMAQTLDPARLELKGEAVAVAQNLSDEINVSASDDGKLVYVAARHDQWQFAWFDPQGKFLGNVGTPQSAINVGRISPDGTRLAFPRENSDERADIFVLDLARGSETRLTSGQADNRAAVWSPDGKQIAFNSNREGKWDLYVRAADGSGSDRLLLKNGDRKFPLAWSPDGKFLLFIVQTPQATEMWTLDLTGSKAALYLPNSRLRADARFSPDGHFVAYSTADSGLPELYVSPFNPGSSAAHAAPSVKVSLQGGSSPAWSADGKQLLYLTTGGPGNVKVWAAEVTLKPAFAASVPRLLGEVPAGGVTFAPDAKRLLVRQPVGSQKPSIVVVLNWQAALRR
jgi:serine/threonine protein kinase/Tol biopolymer transport system component